MKKDPRQGGTSASNAAADRLCEGRHIAQRGMEDVVSEDAAFGTQIHAALEKQNPEGLNEQQLSVYESCNEITDKLLEQFFGGDVANVKITREIRFPCNVLAKPGDKSLKPVRYFHSGQLDFIARIGSKALVIDYKALPGEVVESSSNEQMRDQAVLAKGNLFLSQVGVAVVQPLVTHEAAICLYDTEALGRAEQEMFTRVRNSNNPSSKRTPGPVPCKFCLAKGACVEYQRWAASLLPETTTVVGVPVKQWTPEMRAYFCHMKASARQWLDMCEEEMRQLLEKDPKAIPGWKMEVGSVQHPVTDPQELFSRFNEFGKEWAEQEKTDLLALYMQCVKINKSDFEALVRKVGGLKGKGLKSKIDEMLEGITEEKKNRSSLAKE